MMDRLLLEQSGRAHTSGAVNRTEATFPIARHALNNGESSRPSSGERYVNASAEGLRRAPCPSLLQLLASPVLDSRRPVGGGAAAAAAQISRATGLYPSRLLTPIHDCEQATVRERHLAVAAAPTLPSRKPSGSPTHSASSNDIGTSASTPFAYTSLQHRKVPSPALYPVISEAYRDEQLHHHQSDGGGRRYLTPPWWWRGGLEEREEDSGLVRGVAHHFNPSMSQRRAGTGNLSLRTAQARRDHGEKRWLSSPSAPTSPPLRSRPPSASEERPSRPRSPLASSHARLYTSSKLQEAEGDVSPLTFVEPGAYRFDDIELRITRSGDGPRDPCARAHQPVRQFGRMSSRYSLRHGSLPASPSMDLAQPRGPSSAASSSKATPSGSARTVTTDSGTEATSQCTALSNVLATSSGSKFRLRVYQESSNHPSGFAVPQRGTGTAAPVQAARSGLAALPQTAADRCAIERATNAIPRSMIYGSSNHASALALVAYRQGVAAETGVDPAQLRQGPLSARYDRVRSGMREVVVEQAEDYGGGGDGASLMPTTTRLRVGALRTRELYDPVSGLARKPNEVPAAYLKSVVAAEAARKHLHVTSSLQAAAATAVPYRYDSVDSSASSDASGNPSVLLKRGQIKSRLSARVDTLSRLAQRRRQRANARAAQLHTTHGVTGLPLRPDERRLYWAEHAPLHAAPVRGLNAVLQGVGEAEEGLFFESAGTRGEWAERESSGKGASWSGTDVDMCREGDTEVTLDHPHASLEESSFDDDGADHEDEVRLAAGVAASHRQGRKGRGEFQVDSAPLRHARLSPHAVERRPFFSASPAMTGVSAHGSRGVAADASLAYMERLNGLVDSDADGGTTFTSVGDDMRTRWSGHDGRSHHRTVSGHHTGMPLAEQSRGTLPPRRSHPQDQPEYNRHGDEDLLLYPPLLTPLLQEVDACLRFHGLPTMAELWRWGVGDQEVILQAAGFKRVERQTILWELERMIRVSSTRCTVPSAA
ncbi:hypothetical protein Q4I30_004088 [Leishmania utingensis]|uniref:SAM domain-containing protein n=1 Tax=Leishmania utingensis TaxID=653362 RepID=A0AAW3AGW4_9TRYP